MMKRALLIGLGVYLAALLFAALTNRTEPVPFFWSTRETGGPWPCWWNNADGSKATKPCGPWNPN